MQAVRVKYKERQKYICFEGQLTYISFLECVVKKFNIPTLDLKVFDDSKTEVDEEVFDFLLNKPNLGVLEICLAQDQNPEDGFMDQLSCPASSSFTSSSGETEVDSDGTITLQHSPTTRQRAGDASLAQVIENVLKNKPGGDRIINEYAQTKSLTDSRRRDMVKILVAHMTSEHGTSPSRRIKEDYAKGIITLFPYLADPRSRFGYEHYYNAEDGSGYLAWRLKFVQKEASNGQKKALRWSKTQTGGPTADRDCFREDDCLMTDSLCSEAIALMKHTADEGTVMRKMKQTFNYRQKLIHDPVKSSGVFLDFPRFLDVGGLIEQDFTLMFNEVISAKFLEKWPTIYKQKVLEQSRGLTQSDDLQCLLQNAEGTTEVENGWDSDMSSILILVHLLPPSPHGRKRPGKLSARQASEHLVKFIKTGTSLQGHLDGITESLQPYLLAVGTQKSVIHKYFIVIDKHAIPCKSPGSLACFDELFKAHFVFGTSYDHDLVNVYSFLQTTIYEIDVDTTKVNPRVAELRARMLR
ncbi:uncharacterized protein LOC115773972 [Archocentrus centrarchus]|uniref:uncharacterized protein LOC115773972 n=1 Tax=Archocentrus centrarchus TaxID=63155 RepID=UPI0011E9F2BD|nr:uncharacterized protein LOC115773972 [Archocentrus centrarchus]